MGPKVESEPPAEESDGRFLVRLDEQFQEAAIRLYRAYVARIAHGDNERFSEANKAYEDAMTLDRGTFTRLTKLGETDSPVARLARMLKRCSRVKADPVVADSPDEETKENRHLWRTTRAQLRFGDVVGEAALANELTHCDDAANAAPSPRHFMPKMKRWQRTSLAISESNKRKTVEMKMHTLPVY